LAKVSGLEIPPELERRFLGAVGVLQGTSSIRKRKTKHRHVPLGNRALLDEIWREGTRMYSSFTNQEREYWRREGAKRGLNGRAYFLQGFISSCLSAGPLTVDSFMVGGWGDNFLPYISRWRFTETGEEMGKLDSKISVGYYMVEGESRIA